MVFILIHSLSTIGNRRRFSSRFLIPMFIGTPCENEGQLIQCLKDILLVLTYLFNIIIGRLQSVIFHWDTLYLTILLDIREGADIILLTVIDCFYIFPLFINIIYKRIIALILNIMEIQNNNNNNNNNTNSSIF